MNVTPIARSRRPGSKPTRGEYKSRRKTRNKALRRMKRDLHGGVRVETAFTNGAS